MIEHVADDKSADAAIMAKIKRGVSSLYKETLTEMRVNKKTSKLKSNTLKTDILNTATNPGVKEDINPSLFLYLIQLTYPSLDIAAEDNWKSDSISTCQPGSTALVRHVASEVGFAPSAP